MASTTCGWCGRYTHMTLVLGAPPTKLPIPRTGSGHVQYMAAFRCDNEDCARLSIGHAYLMSRFDDLQPVEAVEQIRRAQITWSPRKVTRPEFLHVPEQIADTASEAHACLSIDAYRAAVALARAVVEATAKHQGITSGRLASKIDALHQQGHIKELARQMAHEIRQGGNEIAHGDLADEPMPAGDAEAIVALMDEILEEVFQQPARMLALQASRLEREQRNAASKAPSQQTP